MKRLSIIAFIIATLALTAWKLYSNKEAVEKKVYQPEINQEVGVKTAIAEVRDLSKSTQYLGSFAANKQINVLPLASGNITKLPIAEGQFVSQGQLIAKLDDDQIRFQIEALEITLEGHQNDLKRYETLVSGDAMPAVNLEKTKLAIRATQSQIKQLKKQLSNTAVSAPFAGIVTKKMVESGSVVSPGNAIIELTDISTLKLVINVPEKAINNFKVGQNIKIATQIYQDDIFNGKVSLIGVVGDAAHNYQVEISVPNNSKNALKAGMYGTVVDENIVRNNSLTVPRQAIFGSAKDPKIYIVENGKASLKNVTIGATNNEYYEILDGIQNGDTVIVNGQINLQNGTPVNPR